MVSFQAEALNIKFTHFVQLETSKVTGMLELALVTLNNNKKKTHVKHPDPIKG